MTNPQNIRMRWLSRDGVGPAGSARHFSNSDAVRQWLVLRALAEDSEGRKAGTPAALCEAYDRMAYGFRHDLIAIDYTPADDITLDIPNIDDPTYLQALVYWSVRMNCTLATLSEAHALLGANPSVDNASKAVARLEHEASCLDNWLGTLQMADPSPATVPMFEATRPVSKH